MVSIASALAALVLLQGCSSGDRVVEIPFRAMVGAEVASCGQTYSNIGTTQSTFSIKEFKMYVSDVAVVTKSGKEVPVALEQDDVWQRDNLALLDFEDGTGGCASGGTPETNLSVRGTVPDGAYTAVRFTVGLPEGVNHLDAATAPPPLNSPGMWWSWKGGYKYVRLDVETRGNPSYYLHLGASACTGDTINGYTCSAGNTPRVTIDNMDLDHSAVLLDVAKLWAEVDLDNQIDFSTDFVQGCMASLTDPECPAVFARLGMTPSGEPTNAQSVFAAGAP